MLDQTLLCKKNNVDEQLRFYKKPQFYLHLVFFFKFMDFGEVEICTGLGKSDFKNILSLI